MRRPTLTQYNVQFANDRVMLEKLTRLLVKEKIDFKSVLTTSVGDKTAIQFLAPKDAELRGKLEKTGVAVKEDLVFQLELPNSHWELHKLAQALADKSINIVSLYSTIEGERMRLVMAVDEPANAVALIEKLGFEPDYSVVEP
ncbi:MAG: hypothetical protein ACHQ2Z_02680 [Elusimicrobiota bacterium]